MPLETGTYLTDLVVTNPTAVDGMAQGDDHLRLLKSVIKATFPNFTAAALSSTQAQIDEAVSTRKAYVPTGAMMAFPKSPSLTEWLRCNGTIYNVADHPTLGAFLGSSFGGDGVTTFGVPNLEDTGRFLRSRTTGSAPGDAQANQNKSHTHNYGGNTTSDGAHSHTASSSVSDPGHAHTTTIKFIQAVGSVSVGAGMGELVTPTTSGGGGGNQNYDTTSSGTGIGVSTTVNSGGAHIHSYSGTTDPDGSSEARPEAFVVEWYIKT